MEELAHPNTGGSMKCAHRRINRSGRASNGLLIAAIVAGFIIWWPLGLAAVAYAIWRDKLNFTTPKAWAGSSNRLNVAAMIRQKPGNTALASYLEREQERLRAEQTKLDELISAFDAFKEAERRTADQRDFEQFMNQHADETNTAEAKDPKPAN
jgi:hypothetical protein